MIILGSGGHARVCYSVLRDKYPSLKFEMIGFNISRLPHPGTDSVVIGVGGVELRERIFRHYTEDVIAGFTHPSAIGQFRRVHHTAQVMAGVVVQPDSEVNENVILNTRCVVDHGCVVGAHTHIAPGAILCGDARIGDSCFIGAGAVIANGAHVPDGSFVKAGSVVK